jgi:hypothetical protein
MATTFEDQAGRLRQFLLSGKIASTTVTGGANRDRQVLGLVGARFPKAIEALGRPSILALTRSLGPGTCSWCAAAMIAAGGHEPAPSLDSAAHRALLGNPCRSCAGRHERRKVAAREAEHVDQITAAGLKLSAAGRIRSPELARLLAAEIEALRRAEPPGRTEPPQHAIPPRRPAAATGLIWAGEEPPAVTAALQAAAYRRPAASKRRR